MNKLAGEKIPTNLYDRSDSKPALLAAAAVESESASVRVPRAPWPGLRVSVIRVSGTDNETPRHSLSVGSRASA